MYLFNLICKNIGPIHNLKLNFEFNENGLPKPMILVGGNGSGKSTVLSSIVDSFFEYNNKVYKNVSIQGKDGDRLYYRTIAIREANSLSGYMYSYIKYINSEFKPIANYLMKAGNISVSTICNQIDENIFFNHIDSNDSGKFINYGPTLEDVELESLRQELRENVFMYFPPSRYEKPFWLGSSYYNNEINTGLKPLEYDNFNTRNDIILHNMTPLNIEWIMNLIIDSRLDTLYNSDLNELRVSDREQNLNTLIESGNLLKKVEEILGIILRDNSIFLKLEIRHFYGARLSIRSHLNNYFYISDLHLLSTGQSALFNLFISILRYADNLKIGDENSNSIISGIVVIDELDLHLHSEFAYSVLPKLIAIFPYIQFVITAHSPEFLLGMDNDLGRNYYTIIELPYGNKISAEEFSEFKKSSSYYLSTSYLKNQIDQALAECTETLIITEGTTDWRHLKAAHLYFSKFNADYKLVDQIQFLEYSNQRSDKNYLEMGDNRLLQMCELFAQINHNKKIIFIFDADNNEILKQVFDEDRGFKHWGNNVYSTSIINPEKHKGLKISIEHLYPESILTNLIKSSDGILRRLFRGFEFDNDGWSHEIDKKTNNPKYKCTEIKKCGIDKYNIINGKVVELSNHKINITLSKIDFANYILDNYSNFNDDTFKDFTHVFKIIQIINCQTNA